MSWWSHALVFIVALPIGVWLWATFMGLFDNGEKVVALVRFTATLVVCLVAILPLGREALVPAGTALGVVVVLHIAGFWAVRRFFTGLDTE